MTILSVASGEKPCDSLKYFGSQALSTCQLVARPTITTNKVTYIRRDIRQSNGAGGTGGTYTSSSASSGVALSSRSPERTSANQMGTPNNPIAPMVQNTTSHPYPRARNPTTEGG